MADAPLNTGGFPVSAGILFGLGLGELLRRHCTAPNFAMASAGYPADSVENWKVNTLWDGLFHAGSYVFTAIGLWILLRYSRKNHIRWSGKLLPGAILMGFGIFNVFEGIVDHHILGIHHVNETVLQNEWIYWDIGFLFCGAAMIIGGWLLLKQGKEETRATTVSLYS